jgi:hypothetical protein
MEAAEIDKELEELDTKIDQVRALYEQYFMGMERLEPQKPRQDVERRLKLLRREQIRNTAQRFKFNMLVQKLNTLQTYWGRVVREMENGTFKRDVLRAAARFGDVALTGSGKKRAKELSKLVAAQAKRVVDDTFELGSDDLIEDDDYTEEDEAPTPPKLGERGYLPPSAHGLGPGDLPVVQAAAAAMPYLAQPSAPYLAQPPALHAAAPPVSPYEYAPPGQYAPVPAEYAAPPAAQYAPPPSYAAPEAPRNLAPEAPTGRSTGLRWGSSDPSSSIRPAPVVDVKKRVAELAAELRAPRAPEGGTPGFGSLDLDFDDAPSSRRAAEPVPPASRSAPGRPLPAATPPPRTSVPGRVAAPLPAAPASGFGVLDIALDGEPSPPAPSPSSPGSGVRMGAGRLAPAAARPPVAGAFRPPVPVGPQQAAPQAPARPQPAPPAARPPTAPAVPGGDLGDQRLRQIYAKYVETKRSANESTAGVTYEKLAATLRAQQEKLKAAHPSKAIDFDVVVKDGKTHLKPVLR